MSASTIAAYVRTQKPQHEKICHLLRAEIDSKLPRGKAKLYHGHPVWFIGENAVVGFQVLAKGGVRLLFWNGQALGEPALQATGSFKAAHIIYRDPAEIEPKALRRWLKKASKDIWDLAALRKGND